MFFAECSVHFIHQGTSSSIGPINLKKISEKSSLYNIKALGLLLKWYYHSYTAATKE